MPTLTDAPAAAPAAPAAPADAPAVAPRALAASAAAIAARASAARVIDSPIGRILLLGDGAHVTLLEIEGLRGFRTAVPTPELGSDSVLDAAAVQLAEYFHDGRRSFTVPVLLQGTAFQQQIWLQLREIPWGETRTYGELGIASGRPTAGRAVGGAVGANPVPLLVPCHRVLAGDRRITGYSAGAGVTTKAQLLDLERIAHR